MEKKKFRVLQIGGKDLTRIFESKKEVEWLYLDLTLDDSENTLVEEFKNDLGKSVKFDFVFVQTKYSKVLMEIFELVSKPYNTYVDEKYWDESFVNEDLIFQKLIRPFHYENEKDCIEKLQAVTFAGQYGDEISPKYADVNPNFEGNAYYNGNYSLTLSGNFGQDLKPIVSWKNSLFYDQDKVIQVWPEFTVEGNVELEYTFRVIEGGTLDRIVEEYTMTQNDDNVPIEISRKPFNAYITVSVKAKGEGIIKFGTIHKRWSRLDMGQFILGGQRYVDKCNEEFMYYFNPGDMKPPLNVYFSGYRPAEGFEGYFMMNKLGAPFLLISDPRIEGGAFYLGSESYQQGIKYVINQSLEKLGFKKDELILSGLSMGSFGALYYGAQLNPSAIIVGKPLVNVGNIANNMKLLRPYEFGTSLDVLRANEHDIKKLNIDNLNNKFWNVMENARLCDTTFAIAYMENDDYDPDAFEDLLPVLTKHKARVMSRGVPGRHNDDSRTIGSWFVNFYYIILESKFGRLRI
nr:accessory Sec system protein Asp2 [Mammaliicoccus sp. Marseille-Q6498]